MKTLSVDSGDLTTHGVIVGMTGSGKAGLGVVLLEEAPYTTNTLDPPNDVSGPLYSVHLERRTPFDSETEWR